MLFTLVFGFVISNAGAQGVPILLPKKKRKTYTEKMTRGDHIFDKTDKPARYKGNKGSAKTFAQYLGKNMKHPKAAQKQGVKGKVRVRFVVESDGSLSQIECLNSLGAGCDKEAIRLLKESPAWEPAVVKGFVVRSWCAATVEFK